MAGLQSQNISIASTHAQRSVYGGADGGSTSATRSTCVFCGRKSIPPASDPHAPVFALFSLVDCPHYACQPCALVHCDNAGRIITCPTCHCVSRLAQTGKKRSASRRAREEAAEAQRVALDDGVSSVGSRTSATAAAAAANGAPRSALKSSSKRKSGDGTKKRASSVQFPADLGGRTGEDSEGGTSPLTADAVKRLPVDPQHVATTRGRAEVPSDAGSSDHAVGLYSLATKSRRRSASSSRHKSPVPPTGAATAAVRSSGKERPQSQPAPQLENRLIPPRSPLTAPSPLRLHTVEEDEAAAAAAAAAAAIEEKLVTDSQPETAEEVVDEAAQVLARVQLEEAEACVSGESDEREIIESAWRYSIKKLQAAKDDDWAAINTRRELEDDFALSPGGTPSPFTHANNTSLQTAPSGLATPAVAAAGVADSDAALPRVKTPEESQVSATSDDASQPSSISKDSSSKPSRSRRKKDRAEPPEGAADADVHGATTEGLGSAAAPVTTTDDDAKRFNARLRVEQLEAVERYAIEDVEAAVRQHHAQLIEHLDAALVTRLEEQVQARLQSSRHGTEHAEEEGRVAIEVEQVRAWGALATEEARGRVDAARDVARREQEALAAVRAEEDAHHAREAARVCHDTEEPAGRSQIEHEEHGARQQLLQRADDAHAAFVERQRAYVMQELINALDDVMCEEDDDRFALREEERIDRRELRAQLLHSLAHQRRAEAYAQDAWSADAPLSDPFTGSDLRGPGWRHENDPVNRTLPASQAQSAQTPHAPSPYPSSQNHSAQMTTPPELMARQLQETERYYQEEIGEAYARLREAERRLQDEEMARARAERAQELAEQEAERIEREAAQRAEDRIRRARLATEQELDERLAAVRQESDRRAAQEATLRALQEEEQRAVLEVKLLAAQRALEEAQQRAAEDLNRAREDAAVQAAAEAARIERQARDREAELEAKRHAENMLRMAQQEEERERAAEQLRLVEERANEAVQRARAEAQRAAEDAQARFDELKQRQAARAAEVQDAQACVHKAIEDIHAHESSHRTTPVNVSVYSSVSASRSGGAGVQAPFMADGQNTSSVSTTYISRPPPQFTSASPHIANTGLDMPTQPQQVPFSESVRPRPPEVSPPPRFSPPRPTIVPQQLQQQQQQQQQQYVGSAEAPSGVASAHASSRASPVRESTLPRASTPITAPSTAPLVASTVPMSPRTMVSTIVEPMFSHFQELTDRLIQNAIREAARELDAARAEAQALREQAARQLHESARRYRHRRADRDRVEQDLSALTHNSSASAARSSPSAGSISQFSRPRHAAPRAESGLGEEVSALDRSGLSGQPYYHDSTYASGVAAASSSAAARTLFFDQPSPLRDDRAPHGRGLPHGRPQYYPPMPLPYAAARNPEALLAGHRYFFQRAGPFTSTTPETAPAPPPAADSPPPRRSQTRADDAGESAAARNGEAAYHPPPPPRQPRPVPVRMDFSPGPPSSSVFDTSIGSSSVVPQANPVCPQCYRDDTTSPCWQCGAMVCRRCGPPPGPRKLCCAAHFRSLKRARRAAKLHEAEERQYHHQQQQQWHGQRGADASRAPAKLSAATSPIPIDIGSASSDVCEGDAVSSDDIDAEAVARLPDNVRGAPSDAASRRPSQITPSQYRVHPSAPLQQQQPLTSSVASQTVLTSCAATQACDDAATAPAQADGSALPVDDAAVAEGAAPQAPATPVRPVHTAEARSHRTPGSADAPTNGSGDDEPKTEKKSHGFFFVPLDVVDRAPRRAKPPTPRNYQPHPHDAPTRRGLSAARTRSPRTGSSAAARRRSPGALRADTYSARERQPAYRHRSGGRRAEPALHVYRPGQRLWAEPSRVASRPHPEHHTHIGAVAKPSIDTADDGGVYDRPEHARRYLSPSHPAHAPVYVYTPSSRTLTAASTSSTTTIPVDVADKSAVNPSAARHDAPASSSLSADVLYAASELLASRQQRPRGMVETPEMTPAPHGGNPRAHDVPAPPPEPRTCGKATLRSANDTDAYDSQYGGSAGLGKWEKPHSYRAQSRSGPRAVPPPPQDMGYVDRRPSRHDVAAAASHGRSGAPTLEELDRRLRQLRAEDRRSSERYHTERQRQRPRALYNPDVYVNMMMPRARSRPHHASAHERAAVSPPWRTDDNSPAVHPPWSLQQPRSPLYRPHERPPVA